MLDFEPRRNDYLNAHYNKHAFNGRAPAAVLTGQPSIGESLCRFVRLSLALR
jgi:hypothetical protein